MSTNNISEIRRKKSITQQQLAERLGVHVITVSKLERGVMQLTSTWLQRLAKALEVSEIEIWGGFKLLHMEANGHVFSGGRVQVVDPVDNQFSTYLSPLGDYSGKWLHVRDDSFLPYFGAGDLVQFSIIMAPELDSAQILRGRLCLYAMNDSDDLQVGIMDVRNEDGTYDLRSLNGRQIKSAPLQVIWFFSGYQPNWGIISHINEGDAAT
ncbi:helix-turn-helix protein [compost metagenome]